MTKAPDSFMLDDPRETARGAPYTYILPSAERVGAVSLGDLVQLVFRSNTSGTKWAAERMWVTVTETNGDQLRGVLDNDPDDIPGLQRGAKISFQSWHVISVIFVDAENDTRYPHSTRREYWERCLVDQSVLDGELPVDFIYREEPDLGTSEDKHPDSGWRIRGDMRTATDEEIDARNSTYIAIGKVLNCDDSWLHLIDEPVGSAFRRDFESGAYIPVGQEKSTPQ